MSVEREQPIGNKSIEAEPDDQPISGEGWFVVKESPPERAQSLEPKSEIEPSPKFLESGEVILETDFFEEEAPPLTIRVPKEVLERAGEFLEKRGRVVKIIGGIAVVGAAAAATGVVAKRYIEKRKERKEKPIPLLTEEQREKFGKIYEKHLVSICSYIYFRVGNTQDTEDLAQRVFERALRKFPEFRPISEIEDPYRSWLYTIAHNVVANYLRDKARRPKDSALEEESTSLSLEEPTEEASEEMIRLMKAIRSLKDDDQFIIWLKLEGLENTEIGQILGKTEDAVKSRSYRIWVKIRAKVEELERETSPAG